MSAIGGQGRINESIFSNEFSLTGPSTDNTIQREYIQESQR